MYVKIKNVIAVRQPAHLIFPTRFLFASNALWDTMNRYDDLMTEFLFHVTDGKPITARQRIQALSRIAAEKPQIRAVLGNATPTGYQDDMQPLIRNDMAVSALKKAVSR